MFRFANGNFEDLNKKILESSLKISQYLQKKKRQHQRITKQRESVSCPDCGQHYSSKYYGENATKSTNIEGKDCYHNNRIEINFLECTRCNKLFGVKTTFYTEPCPSLLRSSFRIIGK